ncbi:hypothetical protein PY310_21425 [Pseudarthrobacter sp. H3Y2-7]|uniref:hypothetical protein n=1 Tax=Pseudarthrobacter naphthalenicus TaxID=3031328 RepID=UPI0023B1EEA5|nr:hypothetical protein [Pseudarthrobacter sp. H3Y2-7]MDE8671110.1 hypothetical protein [Pseudarthrobacter sp. H3Y2-7]
MSDKQDIEALYKNWCSAFQSVDAARMKRLFDQSFDGLIYQPEEVPDPMLTWDAIDKYWDAIPTVVGSIPEWRELISRVSVDGNSATVYLKLQTHIELIGPRATSRRTARNSWRPQGRQPVEAN